MSIVNYILKHALAKRHQEIQRVAQNPHEFQQRLLSKFLLTARHTEFGRKYGFNTIQKPSEYSSRVPVLPYEAFYPYIERAMRGVADVLWPGKVVWFSKSSGTTNAKSKFIPVTNEALEQCHYKGGKDLLSMYFNNNPESKLFDGKGLGIGGAYTVNPFNNNSYCGDVSAVIMANLPVWAQYVRTPDINTALMTDWELKLAKISSLTSTQNVTNISGVPTWTILLLERILEITGKANLLEVWPQFEVFFHGGVSFTPYKDIFNRFFPGKNVHYVDTYNSSEGFFGIQDSLTNEDMLLLLDHGVYYEFIPSEESELEFPSTLTLEQVQINKNYAMVITTNAGLWRYKIGDTIKFTSLMPYRFRVTGRTKHFINAFGEELIIENAETAITKACKETGAVISNFTAAPMYFNDHSKGRHEWVIEFLTPPADLSYFGKLLDDNLQALNSDYEAKRHKDLALQTPVIKSVPEHTFYAWMKRKGKLGGQHKVPRLSNSREYVEDILQGLSIAEMKIAM